MPRRARASHTHRATYFARKSNDELNRVHLSEDRLEGRKATRFGKGISCSCDIRPKISWATRRVEKLARHISTFGMCRSTLLSAVSYRWDSLDRRARHVSTLLGHGRISHRLRTKERFHNSGRATHAIGSDAIIRLSQANKQAGRHGMAGMGHGRKAIFSLPNPHQSLIGLRGRRSHVFVVVKSPLMAADTCNGAEGGGKAPTPPPSLISSLK